MQDVTGQSVACEWVKMSENPVATVTPVPAELYEMAAGSVKPASTKAFEQSITYGSCSMVNE